MGGDSASPVVVVGAGFTGLSAAYELTSRGFPVTVLEKDPVAGGLAGTLPVADTHIEKFYHHWFLTDVDVIGLAREIGLGDKVRFRPSRTGTYYANRIFRLSSPLDLLRYTPLSMVGRLRLGALALRVRTIGDWRRLEPLTAREWLIDVCGREVYEKVWHPLLAGKFGPFADELSAVWIWNKLKLRGGSRSRGGREILAYMEGGFQTLTDRLLERIRAGGGRVVLESEARRISVGPRNRPIVDTPAGPIEARAVIVTTAVSPYLDLVGESVTADYRSRLERIHYLGNVCLVLLLDRSLSDTYWMNVADPSFPFVGIIEHTNFEPSGSYAGKHIVYLSRYLPTSDPFYAMTRDELLDVSLPHIERMFPAFDRDWIDDAWVSRARYAQPIVTTRYSEKIPDVQTPLERVYLQTMAQIYPEDRGTNYAVRDGRSIGRRVASELSV